MVWNNKTSLLVSILAPFCAYFVFFSWGGIRDFEFSLYDRYLQSRPSEPVDDRIVIVGVRQEDLEKLNQYKLDDGTLATVIEKIKASQPRVIGLDMQRDLPVCFNPYSCDSDQKKLTSIFRNTPNLVGIEQTTRGNPNEEVILPHPDLVGRTGDSAVIQDKDFLVRRGYFYVSDESQKNTFSFGSLVALNYLPEELTHYDDEKKLLKLNDNIIPILKTPKRVTSGLFKELRTKLIELGRIYTVDEVDNRQILINYRQNKQPFKQLSISQILADDFSPQDLRDKVVLIGALYKLSGDIYYPPHLRSGSDLTYGVEIHAQLVSYLLDVALNERTVFKFAPRLIELVLLYFLLSESYLLICWLDKKQHKGLILLAIIGGQVLIILAGSWISLSFGYWLPGVSLLFITLFNFILLSGLAYYHGQEEEKFRLEQQVNQKTQELQKTLNDLRKVTKEVVKQEKLDFFLASTAFLDHEIKNPLGLILISSDAVTSQAHILIKYLETNNFAENLQEIKEKVATIIKNNSNVKKQARRITSLLDLVDTQSYQRKEDLSLQDINYLINKVCSVALHTFNKLAGSSLEVEILWQPSVNLEKINVYPKSLEVALVNILSNALYSLSQKKKEKKMLLNFTPSIKIKTVNIPDYLQITIEDNGLGIEDKNLEKIFEEFYSTKQNSLGFGLSITKQIVEFQHHGSIRVESKLGSFTRFILTIPTNLASSLD